MKGIKGFTLVEILLVVVLVSFIILVVYGLLESTIFAADAIERVVESSQIGTALLRMIREDLESVVLPEGEKEFFVGLSRGFSEESEDRIDFISNRLCLGKEKEEEKEKLSPLNEIGYQIRRSERGYLVLYRREDIWIDQEPLKGGKLFELYDMVKSFDLSYFDGEEWTQEWSNVKNGGLPKAVKVRIDIIPPGLEKVESFSTIVILR